MWLNCNYHRAVVLLLDISQHGGSWQSQAKCKGLVADKMQRHEAHYKDLKGSS